MTVASLQLTHSLTAQESRVLVQNAITDMLGRTKAVHADVQAHVPEQPDVIIGKLHFKLFGDVILTITHQDHCTTIRADLPAMLKPFITIAQAAIEREAKVRVEQMGGVFGVGTLTMEAETCQSRQSA